MLLHKFNYLMRHLPGNLIIHESHVSIILIELYRAKIISKKHLIELQDLNVNTLARVKIAKAIEQKLGIFIYKKDLDLIAKYEKAFDSFLLAVAGQNLLLKKNRRIPSYGGKDDSRFVVCDFMQS